MSHPVMSNSYFIRDLLKLTPTVPKKSFPVAGQEKDLNKENATPFSAPPKRKLKSHNKTPMADCLEEDEEEIVSTGRRKKAVPRYLGDVVKAIDFGAVCGEKDEQRATARFAR